MSMIGINSPSVMETNKADINSIAAFPAPVVDKYAGQKKKYVPGGPGGGGHYEYPDGTITFVGGTGPGGQHYAGPKGRVGPMNAANGMKPPTPRPTPRTASRRPATRVVRPATTMVSQEETSERRATQRRAAELRKEKETFKPREEQSLYEFHPDLDVNRKLKPYDAHDFDDIPLDRPVTPTDVTTPKSNEQHTPPPTTAEHVAESAPVSTPQDNGTGALASGERSVRTRQPNNVPAPSTVRTPGLKRIVPAELQPAKERLEMHPPIWRKVETFAAFKKDEVKINDAMARVGYQVDNIYASPKQLHRQTEVTSDADHDKVEYDMDLFDRYWLDLLNKQRRPKQEEISPEVFEITITKIEKEYAALERRVPKPNPRPPQTQRPRSSSAAAVNGEPGEEPDTTCVICDDGDCENTNAIVFCDGCNIPVHQDCYGIPNIPEGQWLCRKCVAVGGGVPTCIFCPNSEGAFKQTNDQRWGHVLCAMWIPEVTFPNTMFMEPIQDINRIPKGRRALLCYICNQQMGAPIQCGKSNCYRAFHVSCAKRVHLPLKMKNSQGVLAVNDPTMVLKAFCDKHCPAEYAKDHNVADTLREVQTYYKENMQARVWAETHDMAAAILREYAGGDDIHDLGVNGLRTGSILLNGHEGEHDESEHVWKLPSGAPVVPFYVLSRVEEYMSQFVSQGLSEWVASATKYWTCKIEIRRGARLIRHYQTQNDGSSMDTTRRDFSGMGAVGKGRLERRIDFVDGLSKELSQIANCSHEDYDQIVAGTETAREKMAEVDAILFPINHLVDNIVGGIQASSDGDFILPYLSGITEKLQNFSYLHAEDFLDDLAQACIQSLKTLREGPGASIQELRRCRSMVKRLWTTSVGSGLSELIEKEAQIYDKDFLQLKNILQSAQVIAHTLPDFAAADDDVLDSDMMDVDVSLENQQLDRDDVDVHVNAHSGEDTTMGILQEETESVEVRESIRNPEVTDTEGAVQPELESEILDEQVEEDMAEQAEDAPETEESFAPMPAEIVARACTSRHASLEPEVFDISYTPLPTEEADRANGIPQMYNGHSARPTRAMRHRLTPPATASTISSPVATDTTSEPMIEAGTPTEVAISAIASEDDGPGSVEANSVAEAMLVDSPTHVSLAEEPLADEVTLPVLGSTSQPASNDIAERQEQASEDELSDLDEEVFKSMNVIEEDVDMESSAIIGGNIDNVPSSPLSAANSVIDEDTFLTNSATPTENRRSTRRK